jgi:hypothetical protein
MPGKPIPERDPVGDVFNGFVLQFGDKESQILTLNAMVEAETIASGALVIRYAVRYLEEPHLSIVPGLVALDYGDMLTGDVAWDFLLKRSNLHPRADVLGYRNDGQDDMIPVKRLDPAAPVAVFVYPDAEATRPIAQPTAVIAADTAAHTATLPERLLEYLPLYETVADWQDNLHE